MAGPLDKISILFNKTEMLYRSDNWGFRITGESLERLLVEQALNREEGVRLSSTWLPACELLKETMATGPTEDDP